MPPKEKDKHGMQKDSVMINPSISHTAEEAL